MAAFSSSRTRLLLGLTAAALLVTGCSEAGTSEESPTTPQELVGLDIDEAMEHTKTVEESNVVVQDHSVLVGKEPSYADGDEGWTVIAACSDNGKLVDTQKVDSLNGEYDNDLVNCT